VATAVKEQQPHSASKKSVSGENIWALALSNAIYIPTIVPILESKAVHDDDDDDK
jgi:hypothetical protein